MSFGNFILGLSNQPSTPPTIVGFAVKQFAAAQEDITFGSGDIAGVQAGDLLVLAFTDDLSVAPANPSGWTVDYNDSAFDGTSAVGLWHKTAASSDVSVTLNRASTGAPSAVMVALRGVSFNSFTQSAADTLTAPGETVTAGALAIAHTQDNNTDLTAPTGWTTDFYRAESESDPTTISQTGVAVRLDVTGSVSPGNFGGAGGAGNFMRCTTVALD